MVNIISKVVSYWRVTMFNYSSAQVPNVLPGFGRWDGAEHKRMKQIHENSWAQTFREVVLPLIPADKVSKVIFSKDNGRPSHDVKVYLGLMIIQELNNYTDQEAVDALATNTRVQHGLGIDYPTDRNAYISRRSFWEAKNNVRLHNLSDCVFDSVTLGIAELEKVDTSFARLDSTHIKTNFKNLTRGGLFHKTIENFLRRLKKSNPEAFDTIDISLTSKYLKDRTGYDYFGQVKPAERKNVLNSMAKDILILVRKFEGDVRVSSMQSFNCLQRVLREQCKVVPASIDNPEEMVNIVEPKEVPSDSLQNPSDPGAGYSAHKGKGYQTQIVETYQPEGEKGDEDSLNLILHVVTESAAKHDSEALKPAIDSLKEKGVEITTLLADTSYGGDENVEYAKENGIELISPVPGHKVGKKDDSTLETTDGTVSETVESANSEESSKSLSLADFERDDDGRILACPMGQKADTHENKKETGFNSFFDIKTCKCCPKKDKCPVRIGKRRVSIGYSLKMSRIADRRKIQENPDFKKAYRKRSGIEATNSVLKRKFGLHRLRVRGIKPGSSAAIFKALALNVWRTALYERKKRRKS
jgi:IS5 family transposase